MGAKPMTINWYFFNKLGLKKYQTHFIFISFLVKIHYFKKSIILKIILVFHIKGTLSRVDGRDEG
jgi:hypothetical protein